MWAPLAPVVRMLVVLDRGATQLIGSKGISFLPEAFLPPGEGEPGMARDGTATRRVDHFPPAVLRGYGGFRAQ